MIYGIGSTAMTSINTNTVVVSNNRPHHNYYNNDDNSNELEELRRKQTAYRRQLEKLLEENCRSLVVAVLVACIIIHLSTRRARGTS